jgi:putative transcriptional regulator
LDVRQVLRGDPYSLRELSVLKTGRARAIRFSTLEKLCEVLDCQPGDLFAFEGQADGSVKSEKPNAAA